MASFVPALSAFVLIQLAFRHHIKKCLGFLSLRFLKPPKHFFIPAVRQLSLHYVSHLTGSCLHYVSAGLLPCCLHFRFISSSHAAYSPAATASFLAAAAVLRSFIYIAGLWAVGGHSTA